MYTNANLPKYYYHINLKSIQNKLSVTVIDERKTAEYGELEIKRIADELRSTYDVTVNLVISSENNSTLAIEQGFFCVINMYIANMDLE